MPKTPEQFLADLEATKQLLVAELPNIALKLTGNAKALAEKNILEKGFGERYSQNEVPAFFFEGKQLNAGGVKYLEDHGVNVSKKPKKRKKKGEGQPVDKYGTWGEFRAAQGRQNVFVDLSYSNRMWSGMVPLMPQINNYMAVCKLGATNGEVAKEISYNYLRYGDFIRKGLGESDFELLQQTVIDDIFQVLNQKLL